NHGQQGQGPHGHSGLPGTPTGGVSSPASTSVATTSVDTTDVSTSDATTTDETTDVATSISSSDEATSTIVDTETTDSTFTDATSIYSTTTSTAAAAHYSAIKNTCVMAPEVVEGPYYLRDDYVRQDIREDQAGTPLYLDIGVLDITTCTPVTDAFVEIWSANAQGEYSGFGNAGTTGGGGNGTTPSGSGGPPGGSAPTQSGNDTAIPTGTFSGPAPSGSGGPSGGGGGGMSSGKANGDNFLRGGYTVDENGIVEIIASDSLRTIYPGFYSGRTVHIHTMVHQNLSYHSNGTIISSSGSLRHIGQFFFDEAFNTEVLAQEAYLNSGQSHTYNDEDGILQTANTDGYSAFVEIERLGDTLDEGLLGYITVGIDTSASYTISTSNYWDPDFEPVSASST
ncbi:hypothetical protein PIIN_07639, partial [Serendipita indica DSM 11827]